MQKNELEKLAEDLFLKKYGNKITASESWVIRFAAEFATLISQLENKNTNEPSHK